MFKELNINQLPRRKLNGYVVWEQLGKNEKYDVLIKIRTMDIKVFEVTYNAVTEKFDKKQVPLNWVADLLPMLYYETLTGLRLINLNSIALKRLKKGA